MCRVLEGSGAVKLIDRLGFRWMELIRFDALIFSPGTVHRLINPEGHLQLLITRQSSGLPERGDDVVTFPPAGLTDA